MSKILSALILSLLAVSASAQHRHFHGGYGGGWGYGNWVAPTIIGGVIGYEIARSQQPTVIVNGQPGGVIVNGQPVPPNPPIIVQQPPVVVQQPQDVVYLNGIAYHKQIMLVNGVYQEVLVRF
jgi:hypothetical protein